MKYEEAPGSVAQTPRGQAADLMQWSTDSVDSRERLDYWVGALSETLFSMTTSTNSRSDFCCRLATIDVDGLLLAQASGSNQTSFRTRRFVAQSAKHSYHLIGDFSRPWVAVRKCEHIALAPGDLIVTDSEEIHGGMWRDGCSVLNVLLPPAWMKSWVRQPEELIGRRIFRKQGWGAALSAFLSQLTPGAAASTPVPHRTISDHVGVLLAMIEAEFGASQSPGSPSASAIRERLESVIEQLRGRLGELDLDAEAIAACFHVEASVLHRWLTDAGTTFGGLLQQQRVLAASDMLSSRHFDRLSLAEIGRYVGFARTSQLSALMVRHVGETPLAHRRASRA